MHTLTTTARRALSVLFLIVFLCAPARAAEAAPEAPPAAAPAPAESPAPAAAAPTAPAAAPAPADAAVGDAEDDNVAEDNTPRTADRYTARADAVQAKIASLATDIPDESLRNRVAEQLKEAALQWQNAARAAGQYARRRQTVESLPGRLAEIKTEVDAIRAAATADAQTDPSKTAAELDAELRDLDVKLPEWNKQLSQRVSRIEGQSQRLADSRREAEEAQARLAEKQPPVPEGTPAELSSAIREARSARQRADNEIIAGADYYRSIQEPIAQLDTEERDLLTRRIEAARARRDLLSGRISDLRHAEAETLRRDNEAAAARFLEFLPESFRSLAEENRHLSDTLDAYLAQEKERAAALQSMTEYNQTLQTDFERIRDQLQSGGGGQALGSYLWAKRRSLQREAFQADQDSQRLSGAAVPGFTMVTVDELRRSLPRLERELQAFSAAPGDADGGGFAPGQLAAQARQLLDNHTKLVGGLAESLRRRTAELLDLDAANKELHRISGQYSALVNRYVLSLPGSPPLWRISPVETFQTSLGDLTTTSLWWSTIEALFRGVLHSPWLLLFLALAALPGTAHHFLSGSPALRTLLSRAPSAANPKGLLWRAGEAFVRSYPAPLTLFTAGAAIWTAARPGGDAAGVGEALLAGALPWLLLNLWRHFSAEGGVFRLYGGMRDVLADRLGKRLATVRSLGLPLWIVVWFVQNRTEPPAFQSVAGIVSLAFAALTASFWWLQMRPKVLLRDGAETKSPLFWKVLHLLSMALCLLWLVMSLLGYNYGALLVLSKAVVSALILTFLAVAALYWRLRLTRAHERQRARAILHYRRREERRLQHGDAKEEGEEDARPAATEKTAEKTANRTADRNAGDDAPAVAVPAAVEKELNDSLAGATSLVRWVFLAVTVLILLAQWSDIFPVQEWLGNVVLLRRGDAEGLTLRSLLRALAGGFFLYAVAMPLGSWANLSFFGWNPSDRGTRVSTATLIRYAALGVGIIWIAQELGMAWSDAQWLVAALSVGIGFGLQEIILNFVCGIILLFERPVRVGDLVTLNGAEGTITRINIRTTTIVDGDRRETIIPNKELITGRVVNWTLSDTVTRVVISVGVGYESDLELVQKLLLRAARQTRGILADPAPSVFFTAMADSSLNFDLRVFTAALEDRGPVQHGLRLTINRLFKENNISIPFPQLDVHLVPAE